MSAKQRTIRRTTWAYVFLDGEPPTPKPPDERDWRMEGSAAAAFQLHTAVEPIDLGSLRLRQPDKLRVMLTWFWRLELPNVTECERCRAIAEGDDGACLGCGHQKRAEAAGARA